MEDIEMCENQERPKKEPEIGSLCLFSNYIPTFNRNIGYTGILLEINDKGFYVTTILSEWNYCKQIEIKEI